MSSHAIISAINISFSYGFQILFKHLSLEINKGEWITITGKSGSGKSTLLFLLSSLHKPKEGKIIIDGINITSAKRTQINKFRLNKIGFLFQDNNLLPALTGYENVEYPLAINRVPVNKRKSKVNEIFETFEIADCLDKYPSQMSGGQQQRVALARAIINKPAVLFADEPTGSLDRETERVLLDHLQSLNEQGMTIVCASHSEKVIQYSSRSIDIENLKNDFLANSQTNLNGGKQQ